MDSHEGAQAASETGTDIAGLQQRLSQLRAAATKEDALKNYAAAADHYSEATEIQAQLNGEMSIDNAELLYLYGRCLHHLAVSKSDVLGGKVTGEESRKRKRDSKTTQIKDSNGSSSAAAPPAEANGSKNDGDQSDKPYFQIEGDENWTDSEGEEVEGDPDEQAEGQEDDDDDFATAYEILDVARVLLTRKLDDLTHNQADGTGKGKDTIPTSLDPQHRNFMERLADTRDLQAEISLENERFQDAITDSRASLELKEQYLPRESSLIAEAHFKLSLALEFASVTTVAEEGNGDGAELADNGGKIDEEKRKEAAKHMELAIESCRLRVKKEKETRSSLSEGSDEHQKLARSIDDVEDMIKDMQARLVDLRNPAVAVNGLQGADSGSLGGILSSMLGATAAQQKSKLEQITKGANDLTGIVRHKKQQQTSTAGPVESGTNGTKRRLEDDKGTTGTPDDASGKRAKLEET